MKCTNCNNEIAESNAFCPSCGQKVEKIVVPTDFDIASINARNIGISILLSFLTSGIYYIYWQYLLVKNIRIIQNKQGSCVGEMLCLLFVPFYSLYWWFTRGDIVKNEFKSRNYNVSSNGAILLVLSIFGFSIVSSAIMQNDFNLLPEVSKFKYFCKLKNTIVVALTSITEFIKNTVKITISTIIKHKKAIIKSSIAVVSVSILIFVFVNIVLPFARYTIGVSLYEKGDYTKAYSYFAHVKFYKDVDKYLDHYTVVCTRSETTFADGDVYRRSYKYDDYGNLTEQTSSHDGDKKTTTYQYVYNPAGQILTQTSSDGDIVKYEYDSNGNIIKKEETDSDGDTDKYTYVYDENNNLIKERHYGEFSFSSYNIVYTLNNNGKTIKSYKKYDNGGYRESKYSYRLDGSLRKITEKRGSGFQIMTTYNRRGDLVKEEGMNNDEKYMNAVKIKYDSNGNILEEDWGAIINTYYDYIIYHRP